MKERQNDEGCIRAEVGRRLETWAAGRFPQWENLQVRGVTEITAGWESEPYALSLAHSAPNARQKEAIVLRLYSGAQGGAKARRKYEALVGLRQLDYPAPLVHAFEPSDHFFSKPLILMESIDGEVFWPLLIAAQDSEQDRLLDLFCGLQVRWHRLDWRPFSEWSGKPIRIGPHAQIDNWLQTAWSRLAHHPALDLEPPPRSGGALAVERICSQQPQRSWCLSSCGPSHR